ncbi:MAG: MATE family efflux transporter [Spirochaetaceae bacterium]|nr:MATE family efflux transporter [Spirochaetaceae bacterium]
MMVGLVGVVSLNLIDAYFIGKLGTQALAAIGFTFPAILLQGAISGGLGVGVSSVVSRAMGKQDKALVRRITSNALLLSVVLVLFLTLLGELTIIPLFTAMGAKGEILGMVEDYMKIWYLGLPFVVIPMVGNGAIRATGNTIIPASVMLAAMAINGILDPIMIFGWGPVPAMGIKGAALATVIARGATMVISLLYLALKLKMIEIKRSQLHDLLDDWKKVLHIGLPAGFTRLFLPLSMGFITRLVSAYGVNAVAAMGMGTKIEMFALVPLMAMATVMIPFIGQNAGAKNYSRLGQGINFAIKYSLIIGALLFGVFYLWGDIIGRWFNAQEEVSSIIHQYLKIASLGYCLQGFIEISAASFNALKRPFLAAAAHMTRMALLYIPMAIIASEIWGLPGIFSAAALSSIITGILCFLGLKILIKSLKEKAI